MSIQYSGGPNRSDLYQGLATIQNMLDDMNVTMTACGWFSSPCFASSSIGFSGQPSVGNTVTLNGVVYTFVNALTTTPNQVLIGATAQNSYANLQAAINGGIGSGVVYSSTTQAHPNMNAPALIAGFLKVAYKIGGAFDGVGVPISAVLANGAMVRATLWAGGYIWTSKPTQAGLSMTVFGQDTLFDQGPPNGITVRIRTGNADGSIVSHTDPAYSANDSAGSTLGYGFAVGLQSKVQIIAGPFHFFLLIPQIAPATAEAFVWGLVPYIPPFLAPLKVVTVLNQTPIVMQTSVPHGFSTGDNICGRGVQGTTNANVSAASATVLDPSTFSIDGSVGNGAYLGGGMVGNGPMLLLSELVMSGGSENSLPMFRAKAHANGEVSWFLLNGVTVGGNGTSPTGVGILSLVGSVPAANLATYSTVQWYNLATNIQEPQLTANIASVTFGRLFGQMFDAALVSSIGLAQDAVGNFDNHSWWNLTGTSVGTGYPNTVLVVVS